MPEAADSILEVIGSTPSVWLDRITRHAGVDGRILAKLDYLNPGFSKKDRAALGIMRQARSSGDLAAGQCVVELTSGNMGTGLAIVCGQLGHPFVAVMSRGNSPERAQMMKALGAEFVLVDQEPGGVPGQVSGADLARVEDAACEIAKERSAFRADQFNHSGNAAAHFASTGPEMWQDSGETLSAFVDFAGSGGTWAGTTKYLKSVNPSLRSWLLEPEGAAVISGAPLAAPNHPIQGGGYAMSDLTALDGMTPDGFVTVDGTQARKAAQDIARLEGIFAGFSAGANVSAAVSLLAGPEAGGTIGVVICDSGLKYLSTDLWSE